MNIKVKEYFSIFIVYLSLFLVFGFILYFGLKHDAESRDIVMYSGDIEVDVELFMENYYDSMNKYGYKNPKKFSNDFFNDEYNKFLDEDGVKTLLEELGNVEFKGEVLGVEYDKDGYYVGVLETIEKDNKVIEEYVGIYVLDKIENDFEIVYMTGYYGNQTIEFSL